MPKKRRGVTDNINEDEVDKALNLKKNEMWEMCRVRWNFSRVYKGGSRARSEMGEEMFNLCPNSEEVPEEGRISYVVSVYKGTVDRYRSVIPNVGSTPHRGPIKQFKGGNLKF